MKRSYFIRFSGQSLQLLSSDYEGLPTVLLEAIAVGTKVVSTAVQHGADEILTGQLSDLLVPRRVPKALAEAINRVLKSELNLREKYILSQVSASIMAGQYLSLIG